MELMHKCCLKHLQNRTAKKKKQRSVEKNKHEKKGVKYA